MNEHWTVKPIQRGFDSVRDIYHLCGGGTSQRRGFISGSYAAFMASPLDTPTLPNDIDIFAVSAQAADAITNDLIARYHIGSWDLSESSIAITLKCPDGLLPVQIVKPREDWRSFPRDFLDSFDQDVCRAVLLGPKVGVLADENVGLRRAKLLAINHPLRALKRVMKYYAKGVEYADWELIKLFKAWDAASPERKAELLAQAQQPQPMGGDDDDYTDDSDYVTGFDYDEDDYYDGE